MRRFLSILRVRAATRIVQGTRFCEQCSEVCTRACRADEIREHYQMQAQRSGLIHL